MPARSARERSFGTLVALSLVAAIGWGATQSAREDARRSRDSNTRNPPVTGHIDRPTPEPIEVVPPTAPDLPTLLISDPAKPQAAAPSPASEPPTRSPSSERAPSRVARPAPVLSDSDAAPCAVPAALRGRAVAFEAGSGSVQSTSVHLLAHVARHLHDCPSHLLEVRAYADQAGSPADNLILSRQRARAVVGHLTHQGIRADRLVATYRGDRAPGGNQAQVTIHTGGAP